MDCIYKGLLSRENHAQFRVLLTNLVLHGPVQRWSRCYWLTGRGASISCDVDRESPAHPHLHLPPAGLALPAGTGRTTATRAPGHRHGHVGSLNSGWSLVSHHHVKCLISGFLRLCPRHGSSRLGSDRTHRTHWGSGVRSSEGTHGSDRPRAQDDGQERSR